jgi:ABC-type lipoprotein export system ATPase subunit
MEWIFIRTIHSQIVAPMQEENKQTIITARSLTRIYTVGDTQVVGIKNIDLQIASGELVVIKGNSGSGKSTLLSLVAGLDHPTRGKLVVADHDLKQRNDRDLTRFRREVVGMVFQTFNLLPTLNVVENACLPALLAGKSFSESQSKAIELLDWLGMDKRLTHLPAQLSGGEMQRTAIARALINDPSIILADEPTGNLDSHNGRIVIDLLSELNRQWGTTVMIATHSSLADSVATMQIGLRDGMIMDQS